MHKTVVAAAAVSFLLTGAASVNAGEGADILTSHLYAGTLAEGALALAPLAEAGDPEAEFGLGLLQFLSSVEGIGQAFVRHGVGAPAAEALLGERLPSAQNPDPEPIDYQAFRAILSDFVVSMDEAHDLLLEASAAGPFVVPIDVLAIRLDMNGNGVGEPTESLGGLMGLADTLSGELPPVPPLTPTPPRPTAPPPRPVTPPLDPGAAEPIDLAPGLGEVAGEVPSAEPIVSAPGAAVKPVPVEPRPFGPPPAPVPPPTTFGFDNADAIWLAGYSQIAAIPLDFVLAHDFSEMFNAVFHQIFPRGGLPLQGEEGDLNLFGSQAADTGIADMIAAVHTLNWPVTEPERLAGLLARGHEVTSLSRRNWQAILAETDDDRELVPSPAQTSLMPGAVVTDEIVAAWHETLDRVDEVLNGELLLPHWRFSRGFDLNAYLSTSDRTDLVMLLTGYGALPYLREGPVADREAFRAALGVFGQDWIGYAFWFN